MTHPALRGVYLNYTQSYVILSPQLTPPIMNLLVFTALRCLTTSVLWVYDGRGEDGAFGPPCLSGVITKMNIVIIRMNKVWLWRWIRRLGLLSLLLGRLFIRREKMSACNMHEPITFSSTRESYTHTYTVHACTSVSACCSDETPDQRRPFVFICAVKWPVHVIYLFLSGCLLV